MFAASHETLLWAALKTETKQAKSASINLLKKIVGAKFLQQSTNASI